MPDEKIIEVKSPQTVTEPPKKQIFLFPNVGDGISVEAASLAEAEAIVAKLDS